MFFFDRWRLCGCGKNYNVLVCFDGDIFSLGGRGINFLGNVWLSKWGLFSEFFFIVFVGEGMLNIL